LIIRKLQVENFRNLKRVEVEPDAVLNQFYGSNGAGKTSVLESVVVLSRGRSFRTAQAAELIGPEDRTFRVFALTEDRHGQLHRLGLERSGKRWRGRKDGADLSQLSLLSRSLPLVLMEPDSHLLVSGPPEVRRKFLDWGVFHVEHEFLTVWRRYSKALKQRNAALRGGETAVLDSIEKVLASEGGRLTELRRAHCDAVAVNIQAMLSELNAGLTNITLEYQQGWSGGELQEILRRNRERDAERGQTLSGPHRADLALVCGPVPARALLSRGEQKTLAAALLLTQAELLAGLGEKPVILLDDLASEFDEGQNSRVLDRAQAIGGQVWVTGTRQPAGVTHCALFHVEQGRVAKVV
jgi:DNA replication and repair protein RecF